MTAWQDQPPLSRRQARQSERAEAEGQVDVARMTGEQPDFGGFPREGWQAEARRQATGEQPTASEQPIVTDAPAPLSRRAQRALQPAEPLDYATQGGPKTPAADQAADQQFRRRLGPVPDTSQQQPYRVRDFSPEGRRGSFSATTPEPQVPPTDLDYRTQQAPLSIAPSSDAVAPLVTPPPVAPVPLSPAPVTPASVDYAALPIEEHTLTRRELRALENARNGGVTFDISTPLVSSAFVAEPHEHVVADSAPAAAAPAPVAETPAPVVEPEASAAEDPFAIFAPPPLVEPVAPTVEPQRLRERIRESVNDAHAADAFAEFDALTAQPLRGVVPAPIAPVPASVPTVFPGALIEPETAAPKVVEPARAVDAPAAEAPVFAAPVFEAPVVAAPAPLQPAAPQPVVQAQPAPLELESPVFPPPPAATTTVAAFEAPAPTERARFTPPTEHSGFTPPTGHWSTQALIDDDEQVVENTLSRNIGATSGAITTNALVIPAMPSEELLRPLGSTGEILITGTIDLPRSIGSTGAHPARYDHSDVDALLEASDREDSSDPESAPVRAIRAVSTHTSGGPVIETVKPKGGSRIPLILAISGAAVGVGAIVLVIVVLTSGIFH